jgi:hypothetical protein
MDKRLEGEHIYTDGMTGADFANQQLGKELANLDEMITRKEEWMAAQALQNGQIDIVGDGVDDVVSFGMAASHLVTLTGADLWSATTSDPIGDLEDWMELVAKDSGLTVDKIIMGKAAAKSFLAHKDVQQRMNMLRANILNVTPSMNAPGMRYIGTIDMAVEIYTYNEWYIDDWSDPANPVELPMMDEKKVLLGSTQARCTRHYGMIKDLKCSAIVPKFPKTWDEEDPSQKMLMLQSAPLPVPHQIDGFVCAKVLN